jgi:hypothetical protein
MLHAFTARLDEVDAVLQRGVHRVRGFTGKTGEIVDASQPVTFLLQVTTTAAIAAGIKLAAVRTIHKIDIVQYQQSRIRECFK